VIKCADRLIDMGPEGGEEGGLMIASGTPEEVAAGAGQSGSHTGRFLAEMLDATASQPPSGGRAHAAPRKRRAKVAA
jgi:excinuclease ABC subunit A